MKEATGELSMTVIVIIGAIAIVGIVSWLSPRIKNYVEGSWETITGDCPEGYRKDANSGACVKNS